MIFIKENAINNYHKIVLELEEIIKDNEMIIEVDQASIDMKKNKKLKLRWTLKNVNL